MPPRRPTLRTQNSQMPPCASSTAAGRSSLPSVSGICSIVHVPPLRRPHQRPSFAEGTAVPARQNTRTSPFASGSTNGAVSAPVIEVSSAADWYTVAPSALTCAATMFAEGDFSFRRDPRVAGGVERGMALVPDQHATAEHGGRGCGEGARVEVVAAHVPDALARRTALIEEQDVRAGDDHDGRSSCSAAVAATGTSGAAGSAASEPRLNETSVLRPTDDA